MFSCFRDSKKPSFPIQDLPLEILLEILYKLPAKQLLRNKVVCKLWSSLISNPSFLSQFSLQGNRNFTLFLTCLRWDDEDVVDNQQLTKDGNTWFNQKKGSLKFLPDRVHSKVNDRAHSSSNGLILCCRTSCHNDSLIYFICNPTTKQWITLPSPLSRRRFELSGLIVCNQSSQVSNSKTTQFKVVRLFTNLFLTNGSASGLEIFDSATNRWEVSKMKHNFRWQSTLNADINGIEHKGILYWENKKANVVIVFDPNVNECYQFPLPGSSDENVHRRLDVSGNYLYYTEIDFRLGKSIPSTIWRFEKFEGKPTWIVHRHFDLHDWTLQQFKLGGGTAFGRIDLRKYEDQQLLCIDPVDCNILYVLLGIDHLFKADYNRIYSLDTRRRNMKKLCSSEYNCWSMMFVQPSWPTIIPNMP